MTETITTTTAPGTYEVRSVYVRPKGGKPTGRMQWVASISRGHHLQIVTLGWQDEMDRPAAVTEAEKAAEALTEHGHAAMVKPTVAPIDAMAALVAAIDSKMAK